MRILFVTPSFPYPPRRGYMLMAYHHIGYLSQRHEVDLVSFVSKESDGSTRGQLEQWCRRINVVALPTWRSLLHLAAAIPSQQPFQVSYYHSRKMAAAVDAHLRGRNYDVVVFFLTRMAQFLPEWYTGTAVLNMVDPLILNYTRSLKWRRWFTRPLVRIEVDRLAHFERKHVQRFDRGLLIAREDVSDYTHLLPDTRLCCIPYAVDSGSLSPAALSSRRPGMVVISGNMFFAPNVDAVDFFCRNIFPLVLEQAPDVNLWLVGARPTAAVKKWSAHPRITVTGSVPDIRRYIGEAMVSVCPVRLKVGTQTKVLEALAMGTPVVTTSAGNNGVGGISGEHLYVADDPKEFADRVISLLRGDGWSELSQCGRDFVAKRFTWEQSGAQLEHVLNAAVNEHTASLR